MTAARVRLTGLLLLALLAIASCTSTGRSAIPEEQYWTPNTEPTSWSTTSTDGSIADIEVDVRGNITAALSDSDSWATATFAHSLRAITDADPPTLHGPVRVEFRVLHDVGRFRGSSFAFGLTSVTGSRVVWLEFANTGHVLLNDDVVDANLRSVPLVLELDTSSFEVRLIRRSQVVATAPFLSPLTPADLGDLVLELRLLGSESRDRTMVEIRDLAIGASEGEPVSGARGTAYQVRGDEPYLLRPSEALFANEDFRWRSIPVPLRRMQAVRSELNRHEPLSLRFEEPGTVYAALWQWDYGFLKHLPDGGARVLHGWNRVDEMEMTVRGAPEPFSPVAVYSRPVSAGEVLLDLDAYVGQWVPIGFEAGVGINSESPLRSQPVIRNATTRHNIVQPGEDVEVLSADLVEGVEVYSAGQLLLSESASSFTAPESPGRYAVRVLYADTHALIPLTVAYPGFDDASSLDGFFPIHFYNGYGYDGLFVPNADRLAELQTLSMFELGANVYFTGPYDPLVAAVGARAIRWVRATTAPILRSGRERSVDQVLDILHQSIDETGPEGLENLLGFYVEDEPPASIAEPMAELHRRFGSAYPSIDLLYSLHSTMALDFWQTAGSSVRMTRAYPIRKGRDTRASIQAELADYLLWSQSDGTEAPLWIVLQVFGDGQRPNLWDVPSATELRLLLNLSLARGVRGLTFFCYDSSPTGPEDLIGLVRWPFVPEDDRYDEIVSLARMIREHESILTTWRWNRTLDLGPDLDAQVLVDRHGEEYLWVTNWNTTSPYRGTALAFGRTLQVDIDAGGAAVYRVLGDGRLSQIIQYPMNSR